MSKTIRNIFYNHLTFEKILEAEKRASKGKSYRREVLLYELDLENNLINLMNSIKNKTYKLGIYTAFIIHEPKERVIRKLKYKDRIVHQWYIEEFIKPYWLPRFIFDSYACIENKGVHKSICRLQKFMRMMKKEYQHYYVVKCDIRKFFYNIKVDILFTILKKHIDDKLLLEFTRKLIYENNNEDGLPIGNYTSQYFANIYLNELDSYVKYNLKCKYYLRYMDDFIILTKDREGAKEILNKISEFLNIKLELELNKKTRYFPSKLGIDFCGYKVYETHIMIRKRCKKKILKNIKKWNKLHLMGKLDYKHVQLSYNSFFRTY